jgi:Na+/proline symporter
VLVTLFALNSHLSIFHMVENAYKVTLVAAFVPLAFGLFWKRATKQGGLLAIILGLSAWIWCEVFFPEAMFPPQLVGLLASLGAMILGSLGPQWIENRAPTTKAATQV